MGCYTSSRNRVRGLSLPICEVAESRIFSLFWSCLFWNGHSEFARPSRTHFPTIWDYSVEFLGCELFPLSQTKTHPCRFTVNSCLVGLPYMWNRPGSRRMPRRQADDQSPSDARKDQLRAPIASRVPPLPGKPLMHQPSAPSKRQHPDSERSRPCEQNRHPETGG